MPKTVITVGLGRKRPGREQYSSDSHQLSVTLETEVPTAEEFRACVRALFDDVGRRVKSRACKVREFVGKHGDGVTTVGIIVVGYYGVKTALRYLPPPLSLTISFLGGVFLGRWIREQAHQLKAELLRSLGGETTQAPKAG